MKLADIELGLADDDHIIIAMDDIEPTCWVKITEDEAIALAECLVGYIRQLRQRRRLGHA